MVDLGIACATAGKPQLFTLEPLIAATQKVADAISQITNMANPKSLSTHDGEICTLDAKRKITNNFPITAVEVFEFASDGLATMALSIFSLTWGHVRLPGTRLKELTMTAITSLEIAVGQHPESNFAIDEPLALLRTKEKR